MARGRTRSKRGKKSRKTQRLWNMKGCSKRMRGGCNECLGGQRGGTSNGSFVGNPWGGNVSEWPGVSGQQGVTNYLALNKYYNDPQTSMVSSRGESYPGNNGYRGGVKKIRQKGGILDLASYKIGQFSNGIRGFPQPPNPAPYVQHYLQS
jgi:hypothetical protein